MRLRLNTTLRAALIAAITTVGYTLGVACAGIQSTDISQWNGYQEDTGSAIVGNTGSGAEFGTIYSGGQTWNSTWSCVVTVDTASLLAAAKPESVLVVSLSQSGGESQYAEAATLTGDTPPTVALTTWSHDNVKSGSLEGLDAYKDLTFVMSRPSDGKITLNVYADGKFGEAPLFTATEGTGQSFRDTVITSVVTGGSGGGAKGSNTKLPNDADVGSYSVLAAGYTLGALPSVDDLNHYYTSITNVFNWNGTDNSDWNSTAANWLKKGSTDPVAFTPYAQAVFGKGDGLSKSVNVTENVGASTMTVEDNYELVLNANVTADTIRIKSGALALTGTGTVTAATIAATGKTISLAEGVTLQGVSTGNGTLTGAGTFVATSASNVLAGLATDQTGWSGKIDATVVEGGTNLLDLLTNTNIHGGTVQLKSVGSSVSPGSTETALETSLANRGRTGNFTLANTTFKTDGAIRFNDWQNNHVWTVGTGSELQVGGDVWMDHGNKLAISGGNVSIGGKLLLGHSGGSNPTGLVMTGGSLKVTTIDAYSNSKDNHIPVSITGGTVEFTTTGNALQIHNSAVCDVTIGGSDTGNVTLKANSSSWTFAYDGMTVGNVIAQTADDKTITLGATDMIANYTGSLTINDGSSLQLDGTIARTTTGSIAVSGALTLTDGVVFDLTNFAHETKDNTVTYTIFTGDAVNLTGHNYSVANIIGITTTGKTFTFGENGTISYTKSASKVWTGVEDSGEGNWNYEDSNWNSEQFKAGDIAEFNDYAKVTVNAAVQAGGITTTGNALVTIENDETTPGSLSSPSVELADETYLTSNISIANVTSYSVGTGAVWLIGGDQTLAAGSGTNNGTIMVSGSLTFTGTATTTDVANVSNYGGTVSVDFGSATARVDMEDSVGTLIVRGGTIDYRSKLGGQTLQLGSGTKLLFGDKDGAVDAPNFTNDIVLGGNATIQVHGNSKHSSVTISGDVTGADYTLTKEDGNQDLTFSGVVNVGGLTTASNGNGTIIFNGGEGAIGKIKTNGAVTIRFSAKDGADNVYSFDTFEIAPSTAQRWLIVDKDVIVNGTGSNLGNVNATIMNSWGLNGGGLEVNGTLNTAGTIGMDAGNNAATIKGTGIINTAGLDLANNTPTTIQGGITINITSNKGIWRRNNAATVHFQDATLQALTADWAMQSGYTSVTLDNTAVGTTFEAAAGRTITLNNALSGDGKLVKSGEGTLVLKEANSYAGGTTINAGTVKASNDSALGSTGTVTIAKDGALEVNAALNLGGRLQSNGAIIVNANKSLTLTEGSSINEAINNSGTVNLTAISLGDGFVEQGGDTAYFDLEGNKVESTANHYEGTNESYVQVVNNATGATSTGTAVWGDKTLSLESDGRIITNAGETEYDTFYVITGETLSNITGAKHGSDLKAINVAGGELVVNETASGIDITVAENASISGSNLDVTQVGIAADKTATVKQQLAVSGVTFTPAEGAGVGIKNTGEQLAQYSTSDTNMEVTAKTLTMSDAQNNVTVSNQLVVDEIVNTTAKVLTLDNVTEVMELTNMNITGSTAKVGYITGEEPVFTEATVAISGVLQGGDATLLANLTLKGGSKLDVDGGADKALTLGSTLTFDLAQGGLVNLDQDTIDALAGLQDGQSLALIVAANGTQLDYVGAQTGMGYAQLFAPAEGLTGNYTVYAQGDAFGLKKSTSPIPEPTTGTLSLLALAALAARRRRK